jgi:hypothetical protein
MNIKDDESQQFGACRWVGRVSLKPEPLRELRVQY